MAKRENNRRRHEEAAEQSLAVADQPTAGQSATQVDKTQASERDDSGVDSYSDFDSISHSPLPKTNNPNTTNEVYHTFSNGPQRPASAADFPSQILKEFAARRGDA